jgi:hypothetical protein
VAPGIIEQKTVPHFPAPPGERSEVLIENWQDEPVTTFWHYLDLRVLATDLFIFLIFSPLPTSITLSFWRKQKGEVVDFA